MVELIKKDIKTAIVTVFHILKKREKGQNILSKDRKTYKKTQTSRSENCSM